jgi:hypothetical protein
VSAKADSLRARLHTGAVKKHHLHINPLRPLNCIVAGNSSSELHESDPWEALATIAVVNGPTGRDA